MTNERYNLRGVSADKEDIHNAIKNVEKGIFPSAFCKIVPDYLSNNNDFCIIMHADGAGTKSSLAYLYWKETNRKIRHVFFSRDSFLSSDNQTFKRQHEFHVNIK